MIWLDAHLSPRLAPWIQNTLGHTTVALRDLGLRDASDLEIFDAGRARNAIILTKDKDFSDLVIRHGAPPAVILLRCGNTSEERLKAILSHHLSHALNFLASGESLVEIQ